MSIPIRFLLILLSTLAYLALSVLAMGGWAAFFSHPALLALTIVLILISIAAVFAGGSMSSGVREDRGNRWVLFVFGVISLLTAWLPAYTDRIDFWTLGGEGIRWIGVILFAVGCALRLWPVYVLGDRFSGLVAIQPGHQLVTSGIYSRIRNPSYLGLLIGTLGWALAFRSGVGIVLTLLLLPPLVARIRSEEALLRSQFGAEYDAYCARTSRLLPGIY